jgi:hypothetical protein
MATEGHMTATDLTLGQAARLCGRGKTTLTRAIRSGRLSASRRDDGGYLINVAELERVFPLAAVAETGDAAHHATPDATAALEAEINGLRQIGELLRRELDDVREDRDRWRGQAERLALGPPNATPSATPNATAKPPWWRRLAS